ncbi:MAG: hypothetical protein ABEJ24_00545 [Candidatus Magasanikbacteria bacterium]
MSKKYFTIIFSLVALIFISAPKTVHTAIDQRCFAKPECLNQHQNAENREDFFYPAANNRDAREACGGTKIYSAKTGKKEPAGFCLPEGRAETQISFSGKGTKAGFANMGEFIRFMYRWSMIAGATLAALVILVSGIQWTVSGGRKKIIKKAKKRIGGAIGGLVLLTTSFLILNTINPALVNLRLPQTWMIKKQVLTAPVCQNISNKKKKIGKAGKTGNKKGWTKKSEVSDWFKIKNMQKKNNKTCSKSYYIKGSSQTCKGISCGNKKEVCVGIPNRSCKKGVLGGVITGSGFKGIISGKAKDERYIKTLGLLEVCSNGDVKTKQAKSGSLPALKEGRQTYKITSFDSDCKDTVGYYLGAQIVDGGTGSLGAAAEAIWRRGDTLPDWYALGRVPGKNNCSVNLGSTLSANSGVDCSDPKQAVTRCTCKATTAYIEGKHKKIPGEIPPEKYLIKKTELKNGFTCNINLSRTDFPPLPNNNLDIWKAAAAGGTGTGAACVISGAGAVVSPLCAGIGGGIGAVVEIIGSEDPTRCKPESSMPGY